MGRGDGRFRKQPTDPGGTAEAATSNWDGKLGAQGNGIISVAEIKMKIKIRGSDSYVGPDLRAGRIES